MQAKKIGKLFFWVLSFSYSAIAQKSTIPIVTPASKVTIVYDKDAPKLDSITANLLAEDIERITSYKPIVVNDITTAKGNIILLGAIQSTVIKKVIGQSAIASKLQNKWECFGFTTIDKPTSNISKALVIAGSDARGTAYGVFDLSEKMGVSPWYWWADAPVKQQRELVISQPDFVSAPPAVQFRGIFINDEDWGLQPWAAKTFEPETGDIGPKTYAKVFELLLRLKANFIWTAMHPSTKAFFHYPGNVKMAELYQIVIGSSHAEPMLRNNVGEWDEKTMGHFNYLTNKEKVYQYWEDRVKQSSNVNAIYSLGMRGVHDGQMEGVKNMKEAVPIVERIIEDERGLLSKYINKDVTKVPQVLTPYKEVLEIYENGLKVPDDVTLMWPDDNYGYIQRLSNEEENKRSGGSGVYYHASYWGRPHDYLWLSTTHPSLIREEMMKAYAMNAKKIWVLNVGDIKPAEYDIQLFMDMAYRVDSFYNSAYPRRHLQQWVASLFGNAKSKNIADVLWKYYDLAWQRKPEYMGWSQTEPETKTTYTQFNHFYFGDEAQKRIDQYDTLEKEVKKMRSQIDTKDADAFYQLVYYPVVGSSWMNKKFLYRDKSYFYGKQNRLSAYDYAQLSTAAYDSIIKETEYFNIQLSGGKWKNIMSMKPRNLAVYVEPVLPTITLDSSISWGVAPEGYVTKDSSLLKSNVALALPPFDNYNKQQFFVDVFLSKSGSINWTATALQPWIHVSKSKGLLIAENGQKQERLFVDIDWNKIPNGDAAGTVSFEADGKQIAVNVQANNSARPALTGYKGFIENNGFVSMKAANYTRQITKPLNQWKLVNDLGYTGNSLQAFPLAVNEKPLTDTAAIKQNNAAVEYDFYTFTASAPSVNVFALPTHSLNNNYRVRYAVAVDNGLLQIVDIKTVGRSEEWKQNVLSNSTVRKIQVPNLKPGKHKLTIYIVDPAVILDRIVIDLGVGQSFYGALPETKRQ